MSEDATLDGFTDSETELLHSEPEGVRLVLGESYPKEWRFAELEDVCVVNSGFTWDKEQETDSEEDGAVPVIKIGNVQDGYLDLTDVLYLKGVSDEELQKNKARKNWLLMIGSNGSGERVGHCGIIEDNMEFVYASFLYGLNADSERVIPRYLFYLLNRPKVQQRLTSFTAGSTSLKNLNKYTIENISLPTPPLSEQRKIATVLNTVDEAIQKTNEIIEQTERIGKGLRDSLFTEGYYEHETEHYGTLGDVPVDWEKTRLYKISDVARGKFTHRPRNDPDFYDGEYPFIQTGEVVKSVGELTDYSQTLNERGREVSREFAPGTIIITIAGNIGDTAVATFPVYFPDSLVGITPDKDVDERFLEHFLRYRQNFLNRLSTKTTQKNLNLTLLRPIEVLKPPIEEQKEIAELLTTVDNRIKKEREYKHQLERLKKGLMQDLLSGTVRTTDTNIEVPDEIAQNG